MISWTGTCRNLTIKIYAVFNLTFVNLLMNLFSEIFVIIMLVAHISFLAFKIKHVSYVMDILNNYFTLIKILYNHSKIINYQNFTIT